MRVTVIGCGYLGAVHAAAMSRLGHDVVGVDVDDERVTSLASGRAPFHEPGFEALLREELDSGRLRFAAAPTPARAHFLCVGTPPHPDHPALDLAQLDAAVDALLPYLRPGDVVIGKSTVPVGTAGRLAERLAAAAPGTLLAWNPEFLREGHALDDTLRPDRLVYGVPTGADGPVARAVLDELFAPVVAAGTPVVEADLATAEMVKTAANAFLATKISFINAMSELCELTGADVSLLADAIGHDDRIGRRFLDAGLGFGGGCLPKDIRAFVARAGELGAADALGFLREVDAINLRRRAKVVDLTRRACDDTLRGRRIAVLGAAFKPGTDDIRESPALDVATMLQAEGCDVRVTDVAALDNCRRRRADLTYAGGVDVACRDADAVLLLTDWPEYVGLDPAELGAVVRHRRMVDGRGVLDAAVWQAAGWRLSGLGHPDLARAEPAVPRRPSGARRP